MQLNSVAIAANKLLILEPKPANKMAAFFVIKMVASHPHNAGNKLALEA